MPSALVVVSSMIVTGMPSRLSRSASGPSLNRTAVMLTPGCPARYAAVVASCTSAPAHKSADMTWQIRSVRSCRRGDWIGVN